MKEGMMWFDNDPKTGLAQKIAAAIAYYEQKYGLKPTTVMAPAGAVEGETEIEGLHVIPARFILPGHLWVGVERLARALEDHSYKLKGEAEAFHARISDG